MSKELINSHYYIVSTLVILASTGIFFLQYERQKPTVKDFVTLAVLSAVAVVSRAAFAMVPHFKPITGIIMICGIAFGSGAGFFVGVISSFVSNFIFGQGPWTPWQMAAYGIAGVCGGFLKKKEVKTFRQRIVTAVYGFAVVVLIVGPVLDTGSLFMMANVLTKETAGAIYLSGFPVNLIHGTATFLTLLLFAGPLLEKLDRMKKKYGILTADRREDEV